MSLTDKSHIGRIFLYSHVEFMLAAGAGNCVLTLGPRQTQIVSAGGTLSVNVGLSIPVFTLLQVDKFLEFINHLVKPLVFSLSFVDVFGEYAVYCKNEENCFYR